MCFMFCGSKTEVGALPLNHRPDLHGLLEMIELVGFDPPGRRFHQQFRIIILVGEERIEGEAHIRPLRCDLFVANLNDLLSKAWA